LFEIDIAPLEQQKRNREFELIVQTCVMNTIRDRIPIETLLRQYIDETQEIEIIKCI
jgi:lysyl-tRNA synthetase class II